MLSQIPAIENLSSATKYVIAFAIIFVLLALFALILRRLTGGRRGVTSERGRTRQPRLGIVDVYDLDRQRQLILLRRDNVEHLLLVGGPNDVVVETNIVRVAGARLPIANAETIERLDNDRGTVEIAPARPSLEVTGGRLERSSAEPIVAAHLGNLDTLVAPKASDPPPRRSDAPLQRPPAPTGNAALRPAAASPEAARPALRPATPPPPRANLPVQPPPASPAQKSPAPAPTALPQPAPPAAPKADAPRADSSKADLPETAKPAPAAVALAKPDIVTAKPASDKPSLAKSDGATEASPAAPVKADPRAMASQPAPAPAKQAEKDDGKAAAATTPPVAPRPEPPSADAVPAPHPDSVKPEQAKPDGGKPGAEKSDAEKPAADKAPARDPFSIEDIEAEFARLLGRPIDKKGG